MKEARQIESGGQKILCRAILLQVALQTRKSLLFRCRCDFGKRFAGRLFIQRLDLRGPEQQFDLLRPCRRDFPYSLLRFGKVIVTVKPGSPGSNSRRPP